MPAEPARGPFRSAAFGAMAAVHLATVAVLAVTARATSGTVTYAVDDAYIHLAIARHLATDGTFGLVAHRYESASSAPLWDLLLAPVQRMVAGDTLAPLLIDVAAGLWLLATLSRLPAVARLWRAGGLGRAAVAGIPVGLGLGPLALTGMEHPLHAAIAVAATVRVARLVGLDAGWHRAGGRGDAPAVLAGLLAVGTLVRFETLFLGIAATVALLVVRAPRRLDALPVLATAVPAGGFALFNRAMGQLAVPNSMAAKVPTGADGLPRPRWGAVGERLLHDPAIGVLVAALVWSAVRQRSAPAPDRRRAMAVLGLPAIALGLQVLLGDIGWFERYQAWLLAIGLAAVLLTLSPHRGAPAPPSPGRPVRLVAVGVLVASIPRVALLANTPLAITNIHEQQEQLGRFLAATYPGEGVIVNDIGWVAWLHDGPLLDVTGIGSFDILEHRVRGGVGPGLVESRARVDGSQVMAVADDPYRMLVPPGWPRAGRWCVTGRRYVLASDCVSFYAPAGAASDRLRAALEAWAPRLPPGVATSG